MTPAQGTMSNRAVHPECDQVEAALVAYTQFSNDCPADLLAAIRYSLLAPGKRLRPRLVLLAGRSCGGMTEPLLPAACAVEMVHAYSLIHDDLPSMDDDALRRGQPSCHVVFGEALAILAGDALLALAFEVLAGELKPREMAARCTVELARAAGATALVGGQAADLVGAGFPPDVDLVRSIHRRKTGAMILAAVRLGGLAAGACGERLAALDQYGVKLGLAFQITDDLLDITGDEQVVGKRVRKDSSLGKRTFPGLLGVDASREIVQNLITEACGALQPLGVCGEELACLARSVLDRNH